MILLGEACIPPINRSLLTKKQNIIKIPYKINKYKKKGKKRQHNFASR